MFHLFANNVHCKRIFFGCCHDSSYAIVLAAYAGNPLIAPKIILLGSENYNDYYRSLNYEVVELPHVFRPVSFSAKASRPCNGCTGDLQPGNSFSPIMSRTPSTSLDGAIVKETVANWQEAVGEIDELPLHQRSLSRSPKKGPHAAKSVLLNVDDERVDPPPKVEDFEVRESMLDRAEERRFCSSYHLRGYCSTGRTGIICKHRHHPALNKQELDILETLARRSPCTAGSHCRTPDCMHGHVCQDQPECARGARCRLACFHKVDKTAVKVWRPSKFV